jgi:RND family efflux transporter MFP subunit
LAAGLVGAPVWGAAPFGCLIEPEREANVGSQVIGIIESIAVERGDRVHRGDVIARLAADVERASVDLAQAKVEAEAAIKSAESNLAFARQQHARAEDLFRKHSLSSQELDQARTDAEVAEQRLAQAREQQQVAQRELELATAQLEQRTIRSPLDGVVAERYLSPGERIEEKPLLRLAQVDPLRVHVVVPVALYGRITPGSTATVQPELPEAAAVTAEVTLVDRVVDPASNTFRVRLALPNPELKLPAGLRCRVDFGLAGELPAVAGGRPVPGVARAP